MSKIERNRSQSPLRNCYNACTDPAKNMRNDATSTRRCSTKCSLNLQTRRNNRRLKHCFCGNGLVRTEYWTKCSCPLHKMFGAKVIDPMCSEQCRDRFGMYCPHCGSVIAAVEQGEIEYSCSSMCTYIFYP